MQPFLKFHMHSSDIWFYIILKFKVALDPSQTLGSDFLQICFMNYKHPKYQFCGIHVHVFWLGDDFENWPISL